MKTFDSGVETVAAIKGIEGEPVSDREFYMWWAVDLFQYALLYWRDYMNQPYHMTIAHYYSFPNIADMYTLFLPPKYRHWWNIFRVLSSYA